MSKNTTRLPLESLSPDKSKIDATKRSGDFYTITNNLTKEEFLNIQTEWTEIDLFNRLISNEENFSKLNDDLKVFKDKIIENFDYAITAIEFALLLVEGIQNLLVTAINYIYEFIYNQLDALLRLGVYSLSTVPEFQDAKGLSLPTTSLKEQADNIYKKFYDFRDPNIPYNMEYTNTQAEQLVKGGLHIAESLKARYEDLTLGEENRYVNVTGAKSSLLDFEFLGNLDKPYFKRDYQDFYQRLYALAQPFGTYDGIFLYFAFDLKENLSAIRDLVDTFAKLSYFFDLPSWRKLAKKVEREKRKRIRVITKNKLPNIEVTTQVENIKVGIGEEASVQIDSSLFPYKILPAIPGVQNTPTTTANAARITRCDVARKEEVKTNQLYYNYLDRMYDGWGNIFSTSNVLTETSINETKYTYEFEITLEVYQDLAKQTGTQPFTSTSDYFNDGQRILFYDSSDNVIGGGFIVQNLPRNIEVAAKGNWHSVQFSDLFGITDAIKTAQNFVASKRNAFIPNTLGIDELLANLKGIKEDIINLIEILEAIINILNINIQFDGKIYAKYVRDEDYDKVASYLTDISGAPPTPVQKFKPSSNATIAKYIKTMRTLQENSTVITANMVDDVIQQIDDMYAIGEDTSKINSSAFDNSTWGITPEEANTLAGQVVGSDIVQGGLIAGPLVVEQLTKLAANTLVTGFNALGSAAKDLKLSEENEVDINSNYLLHNNLSEKETLDLQKFNQCVFKIREELVRITAELSTEFGFSQVFLTYLPKDGTFFPVRWLAQLLGLINQVDGVEASDQTPITNIDPDEIDSRIIENDIPTSEKRLETASKETSTTTPNESTPESKAITLSPLYKNYDKSLITDSSSSNNGQQYVIMNGNNKFTLRKESILSNVDILYGVRGNEAFDLSGVIGDSSSDDDTTSFKFNFEMKLDLNLDKSVYGGDVTTRPRISKLNVYCGMLKASSSSGGTTSSTSQSLGERYFILYATDKGLADTNTNFNNYSVLGYFVYAVFNKSSSSEPFPDDADVTNYIINKFNIPPSNATQFATFLLSSLFNQHPLLKNDIILPNTNESDYIVVRIGNNSNVNPLVSPTIRSYIESNPLLSSPRLEGSINGFWQLTPASNISMPTGSAVSASSSIFYENRRFPAYQYNSTNSEIFKFNQTKSKRIIGDCYIKRSEINSDTVFYPYILIGYDGFRDNHHLEGIEFELKDLDGTNNFIFHRVK